MPSLTTILLIAGGLLGAAAIGEGFLLKLAWQDVAAEKQALAQAAESLRTLHDAAKERTGVDTSCSGLTIDQLIAKLHSGEPCK